MVIDKFIGNYDNMILLGDFNVTISDDIMNDCCLLYNQHNLTQVTHLLLM